MSPLRVLVVHNAYQQRGGEDAVVESELALLSEYGHDVELFTRHNDEIADMSPLALAAGAFWSVESARQMDKRLQVFQPDIVHVHNTRPLISPSIYWSSYRAEVPVVQTLHNFRLACPAGQLLRDNRVCEDCVGRIPWRAVLHACYRKSRSQSAVVAGTVTVHRLLGTWRNRITRYIALNEFCRDKFVAAGVPAERIRVKPNFVVAEAGVPQEQEREGGLFVGRLSPEKGVDVLAEARRIRPMRVRILGAGGQAEQVRAEFGEAYLGALPSAEVMAWMRHSAYLVVPSRCYENFPRTIVEAFASGLPVVASRLGGMAEIIRDGENGLLFEPGDAADLARVLTWAEQHPGQMRQMGLCARADYERLYSPDRNYRLLMDIYRDAHAAVHDKKSTAAG